MLCKGCNTENPEGHKFCGGCGKELVAALAAVPVEGEKGAYYCAKHTKVVTRLRCGRCEAPICPKCMVYTPAGTRCKPCSRNKVTIRPAAVIHEAGRVLENTTRSVGQRPWYLMWFYLLMSFIRGFWD